MSVLHKQTVIRPSTALIIFTLICEFLVTGR